MDARIVRDKKKEPEKTGSFCNLCELNLRCMMNRNLLSPLFYFE